MARFDAIVAGLGGAGSAAAYHLAKSGLSVLGLEQFETTHSRGSSHGKTRIYRTAYSEGRAYVPLSVRAQELWHDLERASGAKIIQRTGGLFIGARTSRAVDGALASAEAFRLRHELLSPTEVESRFPQFVLAPDEVAVWDPEAGVLFPENCIRAHSDSAARSGAELHYRETVENWAATSDEVVVETNRSEYRARSLVLTAGAWTSRLASDLRLPLVVERQFVLWFPATNPQLVKPDAMPVFIWDRRPTIDTYGVPDFGEGVKVGAWAGKATPTPEDADRVLADRDAAPVRSFVETCLRGAATRESAWESCLFTMAPDHNFLIGPHPKHANVVLVSACSGHGFKFASAVGEVASRLVNGEMTGFDLSSFDPGRFQDPTTVR